MSEDNAETLINPNNQVEQPEGFTEAPIPLHDAPSDEPQFTTDTKDQDPLERPDYYPEKFWDENGPDIEKLAKSYNELQKQFSQGKHKAPDEYDIAEFTQNGLAEDDELLGVFKEWSKEHGVSQAAFDQIVGRFADMAQEYGEAEDVDMRAEMEKLGERGQEKIQMTERLLMKAPLNPSEREALAYSLNNADAINAFLKYHQALTNEGIPISSVVNETVMSRTDLEAAIADPRWQTDPAYRQKIEQQWMQSNG
jgi:hypothetical protein